MRKLWSICAGGVIANCRLPIADWNAGNSELPYLFNRQLAIGNRTSASSVEPQSAGTRRNCESKPGWVFLDVLVGTMLVGILAVILAKVAGAHENGINHLADTRAASRLAESVLLSMQCGQSQAPPGENQSIAIRAVSASTDVSGMSWVDVDANVRGRHAGLVGLVPTGSIPGGGK